MHMIHSCNLIVLLYTCIVLEPASVSPYMLRACTKRLPSQARAEVRTNPLSHPLYSAAPRSAIPCTVQSITRPPRLPVWPVFPGVILSILDLLRLPTSLSASLESTAFGGRVAPIQFDPPSATSPYVLLVHHRHRFPSFFPWSKIVRWATSLVLPEGFPAHPHSGFETLTICLKGGMKHRDSYGLKQTYGASSSSGCWAQWLKAGRGVLHEEFWDLGQGEEQVRALC